MHRIDGQGATAENLFTAGDPGAAVPPTTDGTNGTPRTGETTDPRSLGAVPYIWGKTYNA